MTTSSKYIGVRKDQKIELTLIKKDGRFVVFGYHGILGMWLENVFLVKNGVARYENISVKI